MTCGHNDKLSVNIALNPTAASVIKLIINESVPGFLSVSRVLRYLYGFEEYCRSASITFRTIHHNNPRPLAATPANQKTAAPELKVSLLMKAESVDEKSEEAQSESESEKDETTERQMSPRVSYTRSREEKTSGRLVAR